MSQSLSALTIIFSLFLVACGGRASKAGGQAQAMSMPPAAVRAVAAVTADVPLDVAAVGNVEATASVDVKPRTTGQVLKVLFNEGQTVHRGQLLFELDPEPLEKQIAELEAMLVKDQALEKQARANVVKDEATMKQSRAQADRGLALSKDGIFSKEQTEQVVATADAAQASLESDRAAVEGAVASIAADRAKLAETKLQLTYTKVTAPIDGRTGAVTAKAGNLVSENSTVLVTLLQLSPIYVAFSVPQQMLDQVRQYNGLRSLPVSVISQDGSRSENGKLQFIDNTVDSTTGTIRLKASFENKRETLWPGQFVNVRTTLRMEHDRILVPTRAVQTGPQGKYVWVMDPKTSTVAMRPVNVLRNWSSNAQESAVIGSGLKQDEMVISEGQMRLMPGGKVALLHGKSSDSGPSSGPGAPGATAGGE